MKKKAKRTIKRASKPTHQFFSAKFRSETAKQLRDLCAYYGDERPEKMVRVISSLIAKAHDRI